jgi:hypothetical protein
MTWSGRFSFSFVVALTHLVGPSLTPFLPAAALILWVAAMTFLFYQWIRFRTGSRSWIFPVLLASISIAAVLSASPNIYQSLYWQTGMLTYLLPLILFTAYLGFLGSIARIEISNQRRIFPYLLGFCWPFFMGGFSETFVSVQTAGLFSILVILLLVKSGDSFKLLRRIVTLGLLGSLAALILVASAPGNAVRQGLMPAHPELLELLGSTLKDWYIFTARTVKLNFLAITLLSIVPALAGFWSAAQRGQSRDRETTLIRREATWFVSIPLVTFLLMCASILPYEYAISSFPDARVLVTAAYILILGIVGWNFLLGTSVSNLHTPGYTWPGRVAWITAVICIGLFFVYTRQVLVVALQNRYVMKNYAAAWDERDSKLRAAFQNDPLIVYAASLPHMGGGLAEIGYDPDEWINRCVASTYGVNQVIAK